MNSKTKTKIKDIGIEEVVLEGKKYLKMGERLIPILDENGDHDTVSPEEQTH